eukprot:TRINITY_DN5505_c0_g1_i1.p1 TRINITY_DN5505_c0_g1~~TRINITY_DN5505_c0_g1_i1.p1  ORF type:complete len:1317 (+),score=235.45 TRINITY_DN5505_c0_g1_i1:175-4125(+)
MGDEASASSLIEKGKAIDKFEREIFASIENELAKLSAEIDNVAGPTSSAQQTQQQSSAPSSATSSPTPTKMRPTAGRALPQPKAKATTSSATTTSNSNATASSSTSNAGSTSSTPTSSASTSATTPQSTTTNFSVVGHGSNLKPSEMRGIFPVPGATATIIARKDSTSNSQQSTSASSPPASSSVQSTPSPVTTTTATASQPATTDHHHHSSASWTNGSATESGSSSTNAPAVVPTISAAAVPDSPTSSPQPASPGNARSVHARPTRLRPSGSLLGGSVPLTKNVAATPTTNQENNASASVIGSVITISERRMSNEKPASSAPVLDKPTGSPDSTAHSVVPPVDIASVQPEHTAADTSEEGQPRGLTPRAALQRTDSEIINVATVVPTPPPTPVAATASPSSQSWRRVSSSTVSRGHQVQTEPTGEHAGATVIARRDSGTTPSLVAPENAAADPDYKSKHRSSVSIKYSKDSKLAAEKDLKDKEKSTAKMKLMPFMSLTRGASEKRLNTFFGRSKKESRMYEREKLLMAAEYDRDDSPQYVWAKQEEELRTLSVRPDDEVNKENFESKRGNIVKEIFSSEATYVNGLYVLVQMKTPKPPVQSPFSEEELRTIFSNVDTIFNFNLNLLRDVRGKLITWEPAAAVVGDIFLQWSDYFKMYQSYCDNYDNAVACVRNLAKNPKVEAFLQQCQAEHGQSLQSFLIMPVQRIPRYRMLLQDLQSKTPTEHPDHPLLTEATKKIQEIADRVEKSIAAADGLRKLGSMVTQFVGMEKYIAPHRHYVSELQAKVTMMEKTEPAYDRLILFNDLVLFASTAQYGKLGAELFLNLVWVEQLATSHDAVAVEKCFLLMSPETTFKVEMPTNEDKKKWLGAILEYINEETSGQAKRHAKFEFEDGTIYDGDWLERKFSGKGVIEYPNGAIYEGDWQKGQRDGAGRMTYTTGHTYDGTWKAGCFHGQGTFCDPEGGKYVGGWHLGQKVGSGTLSWGNGDTYIGGWENNRMHGSGTLQLASGGSYIGDWKNDKRHGEGQFVGSDGSRYIGGWEDDQKNGTGSMKWSDGSSYEGQWKNNLRHGLGTYMLYGGSYKYTGQWVMDRMDGSGTLLEPSGALYTGDWKQDRRFGQGKQTLGGISYDGKWADNRREGHGVETYPDGSSFSGDWHTDKKFGEGVFNYVDGSSYTGGWVKDRREGKAVLLYSSGDKYTGDFAKNERWGHGVFETKDGSSRYEGQWENGKRQGTGKQTDGTGGIYDGQWHNDLRHGTGVYTSKLGIKYEGKWVDNLMDGAVTVTYGTSGAVLVQNYQNGVLQEALHRVPPSLPPIRQFC